MAIYFTSMHLTETVHTMPGGFTSYLDKYVEAETPEAAEHAASTWLATHGLTAKRISAKPAIKQDRTRYAFPENIISA